ncbi:MAG: hypothetical protein DWQ19_08810 [Crenarchaeota archaeon]|nr:MAG: hypothetical protein DWQ19_08810 [Thermoproteota archaeon]
MKDAMMMLGGVIAVIAAVVAAIYIIILILPFLLAIASIVFIYWLVSTSLTGGFSWRRRIK